MNKQNDSLYLDFRKSYEDYHKGTSGYNSYWLAISSVVQSKFKLGTKVVYININKERYDGQEVVYGGQE